jgi:hypothetical protein
MAMMVSFRFILLILVTLFRILPQIWLKSLSSCKTYDVKFVILHFVTLSRIVKLGKVVASDFVDTVTNAIAQTGTAL